MRIDQVFPEAGSLQIVHACSSEFTAAESEIRWHDWDQHGSAVDVAGGASKQYRIRIQNGGV